MTVVFFLEISNIIIYFFYKSINNVRLSKCIEWIWNTYIFYLSIVFQFSLMDFFFPGAKLEKFRKHSSAKLSRKLCIFSFWFDFSYYFKLKEEGKCAFQCQPSQYINYNSNISKHFKCIQTILYTSELYFHHYTYTLQ